MEGYTNENLFQSSTASLEEITQPVSEMTPHNTEPLLTQHNEQPQDDNSNHVSFQEPPSNPKDDSDKPIQSEIDESLKKYCTKDNIILLFLILILIAFYFYFK